jgi:DNA-binding transcriptional MerR regulator
MSRSGCCRRRTPGNTRLYERAHKDRLNFIQHCRELGFRQAAIREILELSDQPEQSCDTVAEIARSHLDEVNRRIAHLTAIRSELERIIAACGGGRIEQCLVVQALSDRSDPRGGEHEAT